MGPRDLGTRRNIRKADATLLQAVCYHRTRQRIQPGEARQENGVGCELHRHGVDFSDYGGIADCQRSPGIRAGSATNSHLGLIGCVDYAVLQVDGGKRRSSERSCYGIADLERAASGLDNHPWAAWAGRRGPNRESRARNERAVNQRNSMELVVLISGGLEWNCDGAAVDQQPVDNRG